MAETYVSASSVQHNETPRRAAPHERLGLAILESAIADFRAPLPKRKGAKRTEALEAAAEAEVLLCPSTPLARKHLLWIYHLGGCNPNTWTTQIAKAKAARTVDRDRDQLVMQYRFLEMIFPDWREA